MKGKILLAEDDKNLSFILKDQLELKGYEVVCAPDGESALTLLRSQIFHLCLLDVMMPLLDGFTVAEEIRKSNDQLPLLFITAKSMKEDRILGFKKGGDDYITKPFSMEELIMRIEVFLRRTGIQVKEKELFLFGQYIFDYKNILLSSPKSKIVLTQKEADILRLFCLKKNTLIKREEILKSVWGDDDYFMGRSMDVFITKLRKYLKEDESVTIRNVHGVGYQFVVNT